MRIKHYRPQPAPRRAPAAPWQHAPWVRLFSDWLELAVQLAMTVFLVVIVIGVLVVIGSVVVRSILG